MHKLFKPPLDTRPTAHPGVVEAVDAHFERVKPFLNQVSLGVVELTAQPNSKEASPIAVAINEKQSVREIVFLGKFREKRRRLISTTLIKHSDVEQQLCFGVDCGIHPRPFVINLTAVSSTAIRFGFASGESHPLSASRCTQFQTAPCERSTPNVAKIVVVSRSEQPTSWRLTANALTSVAVRSFSQDSSKSSSKHSLSRSASISPN